MYNADLINQQKQQMREHSKKVRDKYHKQINATGVNSNVLTKFNNNFLNNVDVSNKILSGFIPIGSEINILTLLNSFKKLNPTVCMPLVVKKNNPLEFRKWQQGNKLENESFGTKAPLKTAEQLTPTIIITPLLAFDKLGYRLGYGGGFYDRTIASLRQRIPVLAVGVAYSCQLVDKVPIDNFDQVLDLIITEGKVYKIR